MYCHQQAGVSRGVPNAHPPNVLSLPLEAEEEAEVLLAVEGRGAFLVLFAIVLHALRQAALFRTNSHSPNVQSLLLEAFEKRVLLAVEGLAAVLVLLELVLLVLLALRQALLRTKALLRTNVLALSLKRPLRCSPHSSGTLTDDYNACRSRKSVPSILQCTRVGLHTKRTSWSSSKSSPSTHLLKGIP